MYQKLAWRNFDWVLFVAILLVAVIGVIFIWSASLAADGPPFVTHRSEFKKQIVFLAVSLVAFFATLLFDYRRYQHIAVPVYVLLILMLLALFFSSATRDTRRWFNLYPLLRLPIKVQPSEFMKLGLILALARYLMFRRSIKQMAGLVVPALMVLAPMLLILLQPDLGTAMLLPIAAMAMLFVRGARARHIVPVAAVAVAGLATTLLLCYFFSTADIVQKFAFLKLRPYQIDRIQAFLKPEEYPDASYQYTQSLIAIGSGGLTGKGWGQGTQNRLDFVPERPTDLIFAVIGEERGFLGLTVLLILMGVIVARSLAIARRTREPFARLLVVGIITVFAAQTFVNAGMTVGLVPITGMTLPLVSYGGSSLLVTFIGFGLVMNVAMRRVTVLAGEDFD